MRSTRGIIRLPKHCREKWLNYLNPDLIKFIIFSYFFHKINNRGQWTVEEDLQILEKVSTKGQKWASLSKTLKGRNENSVKNRYLSLLGLHSSSRKKDKLSTEELQERLNQKISELKSQLSDENELDRILKIRSDLYINKLCSEDCIKELSLEPQVLTPNNQQFNDKINDRHVTFSEDMINANPIFNLGKASTKESLSKQGSSNIGSSNIFPFPEAKVFTREFSIEIDHKMNLSKNFSEKTIDFNSGKKVESKRESSYEENFSNLNNGRIDYSRRKSSFFNNSLAKSFSKLSFLPMKEKARSPLLKKKQKIEEERKESINEQKSWYNKSEIQNFDSSLSSIGKKNDQVMIIKENSATSIFSLSDVHNSKSFLEKSKSSSAGGSSFSNKEKKLLLSALNNLQSEESKSSSSSSYSRDSKKRRSLEEERNLKN